MPLSRSARFLSPQQRGAVAMMAFVFGLSGCTANFGDVARSGPAPTTATGAGLQGQIHGGQQPVSGATIQLYGVGTTGYGSAATPLLSTSVTTDQNGGFNIVGDFTCPTSDLVYLTAAGGNPGLSSGNTNSGITLMAALGSCSNLKANIATNFISVDEVTTVAAIWALQQFASSTGTALSENSTTASDNIGTSATNIQGLANAMNLANVLASKATGLSPGSDTSNNQYNVEAWQINTIADILAACVNTNGAATGPTNPTVCYTLFSNTGNATDTFQAALYMAKNPTANVSALTALIGSMPPFQPTNTSTNDFTVGLSYSTGSKDSRWIAFDQFGNAWITTSSSTVFELDPTGNIISTPTSYTPSGGSSTTIGTSYEVAVDTANNAWFTDETKPAIFEVVGSTSAGGANGGAGTAVSTSSVSSGSLEAIVVDGNNNVWATISGSHVVGLLNGAYTTLVTGGAVTTNPFGLAVDLSNQSRFGNRTVSNGGSFLYAINSGGCSTNITVNGLTGQTGGSIPMDYTVAGGSNTAGAATPLNYIVDAACSNTTNVPNNTSYSTPRVFMSTPYGIAFDNSNQMWVVNQNYTSTTDNTSGKYSLSKLAAQNYGSDTAFTGAAAAASFTFTSVTGGGLNAPFYLAMDGAGAAWVANSVGAGVSAFTNAGTAISPSTGFSGGTYTSGATTYQRSYNGARGVAVDGSGNVWVANTGATYVTVLVGAATPTVTPLSIGIANGTLASKP